MLAARTGDVAVAEALVHEDADVNRRERMPGRSAVMWAAAQNHPDMVRFLVSKGADLSIRADATDWGAQITSEPRVMYRPVGGLMPLLYAAGAGCLDCMKTMIAAGADKDRPNPDGMTPDDPEAGWGRRGRAHRRRHQPDRRIARANSMTGKQGQTALFQAVEAGRADVVR